MQEQIERLFVILAIVALFAVMLCKGKRMASLATTNTAGLATEKALYPDERLGQSALPNPNLPGPAYLLSALPNCRRNDDVIPLISDGQPVRIVEDQGEYA